MVWFSRFSKIKDRFYLVIGRAPEDVIKNIIYFVSFLYIFVYCRQWGRHAFVSDLIFNIVLFVLS